MALKINQNIFSLLTQRNLDRANTRYERSMEKVSSGERLNRSADDPAAMASSETIRFEIQGLRQNQLNLTGAGSLLGTAESQLDNYTNLLQRARELVVQGASDTLSAANRQSIQTELNEILDEANRIAGTAKYGDRFLLDGQLKDAQIQVGTSATDTLSITLGDHRTDVLGAWAELTPPGRVDAQLLTASLVLINGIGVPATANDGVSTIDPAASALAKAKAINAIESQTGVHATAVDSKLTGPYAVAPFTLNGTSNSLIINGINLGSLSVTAGDGGTTLVSRINLYTNQTGVSASTDPGGRLTLSAADGRNFTVQTTGALADDLGFANTNIDVNQTVTGSVKLTSNQAFNVADPAGALGLSVSPVQVNPDPTRALKFISVDSGTAAANGLRTIDTALNQINQGRSQIGAVSNRLDSLGELLARRVEDLTSSDSKLRDTDYALETARLTQAQILQEAAISMLSQANVTPRRALELLQS